MKLTESISFEEIGDKKFKITLVEQANTEGEAAFTHYLHNYKNGVSQFYKDDAIEYIKSYVKYQYPEEEFTNIAAEEALQYLLFKQNDVPFPAPQKPNSNSLTYLLELEVFESLCKTLMENVYLQANGISILSKRIRLTSVNYLLVISQNH